MKMFVFRAIFLGFLVAGKYSLFLLIIGLVYMKFLLILKIGVVYISILLNCRFV
jgi:hypothetical protein